MRIPLFRIEDENGLGPYRKNAYDLGIKCGESKKHPMPASDGIHMIRRGDIFVFTHIEQLIEWWQGDAKALYQTGEFDVVTFEGHRDHLVYGNSGRQALYKGGFRHGGTTILDFWAAFDGAIIKRRTV